MVCNGLRSVGLAVVFITAPALLWGADPMEVYSVGDAPIAITAIDIDNDGDYDMAVANTYTYGRMVTLFRNNGQGVYGSRVDFFTSEAPRALAAADFNRDGKPDLAVVFDDVDLVGLLFDLDYVCGDANGDQHATIGDVIYVIAYIFRGGLHPSPLQAGDTNCDGIVNIADPLYLIHYIFRGGPPACCQ